MTTTEQTHILGEVSGINKAIRMLNREYHVAGTLAEMETLNRLIKGLTEEGKVLLKEAETLTTKK